jgi:hypothetical protein
MTGTLAMFVTAIVVGFCLQFHFKKRFRRKVQDETEGELCLFHELTSFTGDGELHEYWRYEKQENEITSLSVYLPLHTKLLPSVSQTISYHTTISYHST